MSLDPESPETGVWIDRWLHALRMGGMAPADLRRYAKGLAEGDPVLWSMLEAFVQTESESQSS